MVDEDEREGKTGRGGSDVERVFEKVSLVKDSDENENEGVHEADRTCRVAPILEDKSNVVSGVGSKEDRVNDSDTGIGAVNAVDSDEGEKKGDEEEVVAAEQVDEEDVDDVADDAEHEEVQVDWELLESWDGMPSMLWCLVC
ncbi:hypothetical protein BGZ80_007693 [Entomortierella chlamydospora]|uniref:Uncharacterized protein n=1 Tax=Entomortierella chlamydospora TaxID=101097 RepID=A0A9P6T1H7_9FUNG|nr:hypothetical protein BGZ80_007693 [Entomortierella chlamydospora]